MRALEGLFDGGLKMLGDEKPGPIQFVPARKLFDWVDEDVTDRAHLLARALPKTLDHTPAGRLTRDFIATYAGIEGFWAALRATFTLECGPGRQVNTTGACAMKPDPGLSEKPKRR